MFTLWIFEVLVFEHGQGSRNALARLMRQDHVINVATPTRYKGVGKFGFVFCLARGNFFGVAFLFAEDKLNSAIRPQYCNHSRGPGKVNVATQMFRSHHIIGAAIGFTGNQGYFGYRAISIGIE